MYESPTIEMIGDAAMDGVMGAYVFILGPVFIVVAISLLIFLSAIGAWIIDIPSVGG